MKATVAIELCPDTEYVAGLQDSDTGRFATLVVRDCRRDVETILFGGEDDLARLAEAVENARVGLRLRG